MTVLHVVRAELELARDDTHPLRIVPLRPDPLTPFAHAFGQLRDDLEESAEVAVDLLPVGARERQRFRTRAQAAMGDNTRNGALGGQGTLADQVRGGLGLSATRAAKGRDRDPTAWLRRADAKAVAAKLTGPSPLFALQVLIRVASTNRGRAQGHLQALIACFGEFAGDNHFKVVGSNVLGLWFLGSDGPGRRHRFERRMESGLFAPRRRRLVSADEIAGLLKPPTLHCASANVIRSGGVIPPPPHGLPEFRFQADVLPLGTVNSHDGPRPVGVYLKDTYFSYFAGRSRWGKTERDLNQFLHLARSGQGCLFLDPHEDALARVKPYLTDVADRVVEINLAARSTRLQAAWNLFSMEGLRAEHVEAKVAAVVDSFASALRWGEINNRALTLTTMAAQSLCELALRLPPETAPTIFQVSTLLSNDEWREAVIPHLSKALQDFWLSRFPHLSAEAITPVTNLIDRLRSSVGVSALLGASRSTYRIRQAMDEGLIVLACPAGVGDKDRLIANFLVYDVLQAALSRKDTAPDRRRPFHVFFDEVQTYDGASRGNLAALLEQAAKYGVRAFLMNQNPERLTQATFDAVTTNRSHLATTTSNARAATILAREFGGAVAAPVLTRLERYTYVTSVTLGGHVTPPFLVRGFELGELWADHHHPEKLADLEVAIDRNSGRRAVSETLAALDTLDRRIVATLGHRLPSAGPVPEPPAPTRQPAAARPSDNADGPGQLFVLPDPVPGPRRNPPPRSHVRRFPTGPDPKGPR